MFFCQNAGFKYSLDDDDEVEYTLHKNQVSNQESSHTMPSKESEYTEGTSQTQECEDDGIEIELAPNPSDASPVIAND